MRISMLGFERTTDDRGRIPLLINRGLLKRGHGRILTPIGGGFEYKNRGLKSLRRLDAANFEGRRDLRFTVPDAKVQQVIAWFQKRRDREISAMREMREELVKETQLLTLGNLADAKETFRDSTSMDGTTHRDVPEKQTLYLVEVFDVTMNPRALQILLAASRVPLDRRWIHFVTPGEIDRGRTHEEVTIGRISRTLL